MNRAFDANVISPVNAMIDHSKFPYLNYPLHGGLLFAGETDSHVAQPTAT